MTLLSVCERVDRALSHSQNQNRILIYEYTNILICVSNRGIIRERETERPLNLGFNLSLIDVSVFGNGNPTGLGK